MHLYARDRLPAGYHDDVWSAFLQKKIDDLREHGIPQEFLLVLAEDLELRVLDQEYTREARMEIREIRDSFRRKR